MFEKQPQDLRQKVKQLATEALSKSDPSAWFEVLYTEAQGDITQIPWAKLTVNPYLQNWLLTYSPQSQGSSAIVIGCGLGDDAEALAELGFRVTAFDISPTAIAWCRQRFPDSLVTYAIADLLDIPSQWHHTFDLVVESRNLQALPLSVRSCAIRAVASLVAIGGTLLLINRFRETETEPDGPPWPLSNLELAQFAELGLCEVRRTLLMDPEQPDVKHIRLEYQRQI
ncbi:class I SAM-dependent methyltransferase [Chlorogloeopsis sp. ULAP02]|uniref:class I SAM-dependent methyltransferase n=1 Tax=Chlorogloeopsis sp. ULAP02 TaxID=3107926 RepID=UPI00313533C4